jgi:hypothetical protein
VAPRLEHRVGDDLRACLASHRHDRLLLPRYIDTSTHTDAEFRAWLTGVATLLPRRRQAEATGQFLEAAS